MFYIRIVVNGLAWKDDLLNTRIFTNAKQFFNPIKAD